MTDSLLERFRVMARMRHFEEACLEGAVSREIHGELHLGIGQEAIAAGMRGSLRADDALVSTHRNHLHAIAKDVPLEPMLAEIYEKETGLCRGRGGHMHLFDPAHNFSTTGIVGSSIPVALGYAYAAAMEGSDAIAVALTGDGGTNTGSFHECLNMAGAWKLPLVVVVENNLFAISVQSEHVTAYAAWGRTVDGTDVEAVARAFAEAAQHARDGHGPALLEATCYRFRGHFEGDTDHYRPAADRERGRRERDPLVIARARLIARDEATDEQLDALIDRSEREIAGLLATVRAAAQPLATGALDGV